MGFVDIQYLLRVAYINRLSGITYNGSVVPVRDMFARDSDTYPYIVIADQSDVPLPENRNSFMRRVTATMEIVTAFPVGSTGGRSQGEQIANQIYPLILSKDSADWITLGDGIIVGDTELQNSNTLTDVLESGAGYRYIYRKILTFAHDISMR